jgi:hypothetical protein
MSTKVKSKPVVLEVVGEVLFSGHPLPVGRYKGREKQLGVPMMGGQTNWTAPEYLLGLTAEQMRAANMLAANNLIALEDDLTSYVRSGAIKVR